MVKKKRFTGEFPPLEILNKYANWEFALGEEHIDGQDETTLRPANEQAYISENVAYTAAVATFASGLKRPALIEIFTGTPNGINVFKNDDEVWRICYDYLEKKWIPFIEYWLPERERGLTVSMSDKTVFPLVIESRLPYKRKGKPIHFIVKSDGTIENKGLGTPL